MNPPKYSQIFLMLGVWLSFIVFMCTSEMSASKTLVSQGSCYSLKSLNTKGFLTFKSTWKALEIYSF